jgi:hypothetical protein
LCLNQTSYLVLMLDNFENLTSVIWTHDYRGIQNKDVCHKGVGLSCLDIFHCRVYFILPSSYHSVRINGTCFYRVLVLFQDCYRKKFIKTSVEFNFSQR